MQPYDDDCKLGGTTVHSQSETLQNVGTRPWLALLASCDLVPDNPIMTMLLKEQSNETQSVLYFC